MSAIYFEMHQKENSLMDGGRKKKKKIKREHVPPLKKKE